MSFNNNERKEEQSEYECSAEERRKKAGTFTKRAIDASSKFTNPFKKKSSKTSDNLVSSSTEEIRNSEELRVVDSFREELKKAGLLPRRLDDYHTMLR